MRKVFTLLFFMVISSAAIAESSILLLPSVITVWQNAENPPAPGFSLKAYNLEKDSAVSFRTFEMKGSYFIPENRFRIDVVWPSFFGFLSPGFSVDLDPAGAIPWFLVELDLFFFPFAFVTIMLFEKPAFIPSVFMTYRVGPSGDGFDVGIRLSIPIFHKGNS